MKSGRARFTAKISPGKAKSVFIGKAGRRKIRPCGGKASLEISTFIYGRDRLLFIAAGSLLAFFAAIFAKKEIHREKKDPFLRSRP